MPVTEIENTTATARGGGDSRARAHAAANGGQQEGTSHSATDAVGGSTTQDIPADLQAEIAGATREDPLAGRDPAGHDPADHDPAGENPLARLTPAQIEAIAREFDAIHEEIRADLGEDDSRYIRNLIAAHRRLVIAARLLLALGSRRRPVWLAGTAALSLAKILENMEIGHNVMHGQWDWMNDPDINSRSWDWDTASPAASWRHSHNYEHHTFTNIRGLDRDLGYEIMRIDPEQRWHPVYLLQPLYNLLLMGFFEWGVAMHDLDFEAISAGRKPRAEALAELRAIGGKARTQIVKDYLAFPALSRGGWRATLAANFTANIVRNVWAHSIIFCGHFPDGTYTFSQHEVENETRGAWYVRQLLGSANIDGGPVFHLLAGNLSFQVEHHLFPDIPSNRYASIAPRVRAVCERYGLPYNTGPLHRQLGSVHRTILRLAFPGGGQRARRGRGTAAG
jgi:fatty acid desaturase